MYNVSIPSVCVFTILFFNLQFFDGEVGDEDGDVPGKSFIQHEANLLILIAYSNGFGKVLNFFKQNRMNMKSWLLLLATQGCRMVFGRHHL